MNNPILAGILPVLHQGKVRDTYSLPDFPGLRLIHATMRVSTHNVSHLSLIPQKGEILLAITLFWEQLLQLQKGTHTHTIAYGRKIYDFLPNGQTYPENFHLEAIVVMDVRMFLYEFIFRGRMAGSLWKDYYSQDKPNPYGLILPEGMRLMDEFPQPIFTPTDKSATDDPVSIKELEGLLRSDTEVLRGIYLFMRQHALKQGIDMIDTKLEAGLDATGRRTLADEWGTPDSSRFVEASSIIPGEEPIWLDKQFLREEAEAAWKAAGRGKFPLAFSTETIAETIGRYHEIVERLTGKSLSSLQRSLGMT